MRELTFLVLASIFGESCTSGFPKIEGRILCATRTLEKQSPPLVWSAAIRDGRMTGFAAFNAKEFGFWKRKLLLPEVGDEMRFVDGQAEQPGFQFVRWTVRANKSQAIIEHHTDRKQFGFYWEVLCQNSQEKCDALGSLSQLESYTIAYSVCQQGRFN